MIRRVTCSTVQAAKCRHHFRIQCNRRKCGHAHAAYTRMFYFPWTPYLSVGELWLSSTRWLVFLLLVGGTIQVSVRTTSQQYTGGDVFYVLLRNRGNIYWAYINNQEANCKTAARTIIDIPLNYKTTTRDPVFMLLETRPARKNSSCPGALGAPRPWLESALEGVLDQGGREHEALGVRRCCCPGVLGAPRPWLHDLQPGANLHALSNYKIGKVQFSPSN